MTGFMVLLLVAVAVAALGKYSDKFNKDLFGSSTSMFFRDGNMGAGAAC
ncbi:MAG: hypothetical protein K2N13_00460 [Paraprevotella sp.]|nr:hypothetical protein [Paraprevotella sp.]